MLALLFRLLFVAGVIYFIRQVVSAYKIVSNSISGGKQQRKTDSQDKSGYRGERFQRPAGSGPSAGNADKDAGYRFSEADVVDVSYTKINKEDEFQEHK